MSGSQILVLAKSPEAGVAKTRLSPPCTPGQAAEIAEAALRRTLQVCVRTPARRRILVLDGVAGNWDLSAFETIPQRGDSLNERLAAAFEDAGCPSLLIAMDTPQVSVDLLSNALEALMSPGVDAVIGPAFDGGYWTIGLRVPDGRIFKGIPMSLPWSGRAQSQRLRELGLRVVELPVLRDVDDFEDALAVASEIPHSLFAHRVRAVDSSSVQAIRTGG